MKGVKYFKIIRYREFKSFDKEVKKIKPAEAVLPPPSSKFGKRNLSEEFIADRVEKLSTYLKEICSSDELSKTPVITRFLMCPDPDALLLEALNMTIHALRTKHKIWCSEEVSSTQEEAILREVTKVVARDHDFDSAAAARAVAGTGAQSKVAEAWEYLRDDKSLAHKQTEGILSIEYSVYKANEAAVRKRFAELIEPAFDPVRDQLNTAIDSFIQNLVPPAFGGNTLGVDTLHTDFLRVVNSADAMALPVLLARARDTRNNYLEFLQQNIFPGTTEVVHMLGSTLVSDLFTESGVVTAAAGELNRFVSELLSLMGVEFWVEPLRVIFGFKDTLSRIDVSETTNIDGAINKTLREFRVAVEESEFHFCAEAKRVWWNLSTPAVPPAAAAVLAPLVEKQAEYIRKDFAVHCLMRFWNVFTDTAWGTFYDKSAKISWSEKVDRAYDAGARAFHKSMRNRFVGAICNLATNFFKLSVIGPLFNETFEKMRDGAVAEAVKECVEQKTLAAFGIRSLFYSVLDEVVSEYCKNCTLKKKDLIETSSHNLFCGIPPGQMTLK